MSLYLDSSALVKLVITDAETASLRAFLRSRPARRVTCDLARVEVIRAISPAGETAIATAQRLLSRLHMVRLSRELLDAAAGLGPAVLRSLDAIHLAAARRVPDLDAVVAYDRRMLDAAEQLGLRTERP